MQYWSTRDKSRLVTADMAIAEGLSPDGGLYTPEHFPSLRLSDIQKLCPMHYQERAAYILGLYLDGFTKEEIESLVNAAYQEKNFDDPAIAPLRLLDDRCYFLELWHGPTCAFKDMALQILPYLLTASLKKHGEQRQVCILTATSGDTGKAALEGFKDVDRTRILVFYPENGVSDIQKLQMTTQEGKNVGVCAVKGNFDDAQAGVKAIFSDPVLREELSQKGYMLSSANSINWGRLLPQIVYYVSAYCDLVNRGGVALGDSINFCVPTGNFGDILAGWFAKRMGLPVHKLICASNCNNVLTEFINTGVYDRNRPFYTTISPSMDILVSSNLERLLFDLSAGDDAFVRSCMQQLAETGRYSVTEELRAQLDANFWAEYCDDDRTKRTIAAAFRDHDYLMDTHTAVALDVLNAYRDATGDARPAVVVSTASAYKFCGSVLEALGDDASAAGLDQIDRLEEATATKAPKPLLALRSKMPRFSGSIEKGEMRAWVQENLR